LRGSGATRLCLALDQRDSAPLDRLLNLAQIPSPLGFLSDPVGAERQKTRDEADLSATLGSSLRRLLLAFSSIPDQA
jgi:hypothetical protein